MVSFTKAKLTVMIAYFTLVAINPTCCRGSNKQGGKGIIAWAVSIYNGHFVGGVIHMNHNEDIVSSITLGPSVVHGPLWSLCQLHHVLQQLSLFLRWPYPRVVLYIVILCLSQEASWWPHSVQYVNF
mmetsp:Transcript_43017/g.77289  ORF Transcript_43017/g.77289 Transcript_43017/m.77289 type:complete len:127 (-) Transcript_43017:230-610(-)